MASRSLDQLLLPQPKSSLRASYCLPVRQISECCNLKRADTKSDHYKEESKHLKSVSGADVAFLKPLEARSTAEDRNLLVRCTKLNSRTGSTPSSRRFVEQICTTPVENVTQWGHDALLQIQGHIEGNILSTQWNQNKDAAGTLPGREWLRVNGVARAARKAAGALLALSLVATPLALPEEAKAQTGFTSAPSMERILAEQLARRLRDMSEEELVDVIEQLLMAQRPGVAPPITDPAGASRAGQGSLPQERPSPVGARPAAPLDSPGQPPRVQEQPSRVPSFRLGQEASSNEKVAPGSLSSAASGPAVQGRSGGGLEQISSEQGPAGQVSVPGGMSGASSGMVPSLAAGNDPLTSGETESPPPLTEGDNGPMTSGDTTTQLWLEWQKRSWEGPNPSAQASGEQAERPGVLPGGSSRVQDQSRAATQPELLPKTAPEPSLRRLLPGPMDIFRDAFPRGGAGAGQPNEGQGGRTGGGSAPGEVFLQGLLAVAVLAGVGRASEALRRFLNGSSASGPAPPGGGGEAPALNPAPPSRSALSPPGQAPSPGLPQGGELVEEAARGSRVGGGRPGQEGGAERGGRPASAASSSPLAVWAFGRQAVGQVASGLADMVQGGRSFQEGGPVLWTRSRGRTPAAQSEEEPLPGGGVSGPRRWAGGSGAGGSGAGVGPDQGRTPGTGAGVEAGVVPRDGKVEGNVPRNGRGPRGLTEPGSRASAFGRLRQRQAREDHEDLWWKGPPTASDQVAVSEGGGYGGGFRAAGSLRNADGVPPVPQAASGAVAGIATTTSRRRATGALGSVQEGSGVSESDRALAKGSRLSTNGAMPDGVERTDSWGAEPGRPLANDRTGRGAGGAGGSEAGLAVGRAEARERANGEARYSSPQRGSANQTTGQSGRSGGKMPPPPPLAAAAAAAAASAGGIRPLGESHMGWGRQGTSRPSLQSEPSHPATSAARGQWDVSYPAAAVLVRDQGSAHGAAGRGVRKEYWANVEGSSRRSVGGAEREPRGVGRQLWGKAEGGAPQRGGVSRGERRPSAGVSSRSSPRGEEGAGAEGRGPEDGRRGSGRRRWGLPRSDWLEHQGILWLRDLDGVFTPSHLAAASSSSSSSSSSPSPQNQEPVVGGPSDASPEPPSSPPQVPAGVS